jgi:hypothetical protein
MLRSLLNRIVFFALAGLIVLLPPARAADTVASATPSSRSPAASSF